MVGSEYTGEQEREGGALPFARGETANGRRAETLEIATRRAADVMLGLTEAHIGCVALCREFLEEPILEDVKERSCEQ